MQFVGFAPVEPAARRWRTPLVLLWLMIGSGCSLPTIPAPVLRDQLYARPRAEVWTATLNTLRQQGVIINTAEPSSGIISYTTILDDEDAVRQTVLQRDVKASQGAAYTTVFLQEKGQATKVHAHTKVRVPQGGALLSSGGAIEQRLFAGLRAQLGSGPVVESAVKSFVPPVTPQPQTSSLESMRTQEARVQAAQTLSQGRNEAEAAPPPLDSARLSVPDLPFDQRVRTSVAALRAKFPQLSVHQRENTVVFRGYVPHQAAFQEVTRFADQLSQECGVVTVIELSFPSGR